MHNALYVFENWDKNLSHKKLQYSYSKKMFTWRANLTQITRGVFINLYQRMHYILSKILHKYQSFI